MPDDLKAAALRHRRDAEFLATSNKLDNAGHLIGFAAECAIKLAFQHQTREVLDGHFPSLCWLIKRRLEGRNLNGQLLQIVRRRPELFQAWDINNRYSADGHVTEQSYQGWMQDTDRAFQIARIRANV